MEYSLLIFGAFLIFLALDPNLRVLSVSDSLKGWGDNVIIKHVFEFPPRDSDNILVNFESLYGMWEAFLSVRATITLPKVVKLLFIFFASSKVYPWAPVFIIFSDPAKSTKNSFPILQEPSSLLVMLIVKIN